MDLTGLTTKSRSIYVDSGEFMLDVFFDSEPTNIDFGLSGQYSTQKMSIKSGKVLDSSGKMIDLFNSGNKYSIVGKNNNVNYCSNDRVLSVNVDPLIFSGDCSLFYTNRSAATESASIYFNTLKPTLTYRTGTTINSLNFTGEIVNESSKSIRLFEFSGEYITTGTHSSTIAAGATGTFDFSTTDTGVNDGSFLIDFTYNFGTDQETIPYVNITAAAAPTGYINMSYAGPINDSSTSVDVLYFWEEDSDLSITFEYTSGSGNIYKETTIFDAFGSGDYSGIISQVGTLYSTNLVGTGNYSFYYNEVLLQGEGVTGTAGNGILENVVATGRVEHGFFSTVVGYESGILATGTLYVILSQYLDESYSGIYTFPTGFVTGTPYQSQYDIGFGLQTFQNLTGLYTGVSPELTVPLENVYITKYGSGIMTDAVTDILVGSKNLTTVWNITSGLMGETGVDFKANLMYSGNFYTGTSSVPSGINYLQIGIDYTNAHEFSYDSGTLTVSNGFITESLTIYG